MKGTIKWYTHEIIELAWRSDNNFDKLIRPLSTYRYLFRWSYQFFIAYLCLLVDAGTILCMSTVYCIIMEFINSEKDKDKLINLYNEYMYIFEKFGTEQKSI
jgi:hypothetical protein